MPAGTMESALDPVTVLGLNKDDKPPPPPALIRPYNPETDSKVARYIVGASIMEPSAIANLYTLWTPFVVFIWGAFTHTLITRFAGGWPASVYKTIDAVSQGSFPTFEWSNWASGIVSWLATTPFIVAPPIVLLAMFEFRHRNMFEDEMTRAIGEEDMRDIVGYYNVQALEDPTVKDKQGGRKGFWVLDYDKRIIGAMGLDGLKPTEHLDSVIDVLPDKNAKLAIDASEKADSKSTATKSTTPLKSRKASPKPTSSSSPAPTTLFLRRFATSLSFRTADIEDDLLEFVADYAFSPTSSSGTPPANRIVITLRPAVQNGTVKRIKKHGFKELAKSSPDHVDMDRWKRAPETKKRPGAIAVFLTNAWPLDLGWKTYALDKADWEKRKK